MDILKSRPRRHEYGVRGGKEKVSLANTGLCHRMIITRWNSGYAVFTCMEVSTHRKCDSKLRIQGVINSTQTVYAWRSSLHVHVVSIFDTIVNLCIHVSS